jgi:8-oxo-dGTP pyrophosphatase MutT (NUDIX family)
MTLTAEALRRRLRARFAGTRPGPLEAVTLAGLPPGETERFRALLPRAPRPAAVLVPLVDHEKGLTVLLTERASDLRHHAGQIAFPGGRVEPGDAGPVEAALRETEEEIGLAREHVEVLGFLSDHVVMTGFRVTPVVALVRPGFTLRTDPTEVAEVFEVPLAFVLDPANHGLRRRTFGGQTYDVYEMPYGRHDIWGATAGMLAALWRALGETGDEEERR